MGNFDTAIQYLKDQWVWPQQGTFVLTDGVLADALTAQGLSSPQPRDILDLLSSLLGSSSLIHPNLAISARGHFVVAGRVTSTPLTYGSSNRIGLIGGEGAYSAVLEVVFGDRGYTLEGFSKVDGLLLNMDEVLVEGALLHDDGRFYLQTGLLHGAAFLLGLNPVLHLLLSYTAYERAEMKSRRILADHPWGSDDLSALTHMASRLTNSINGADAEGQRRDRLSVITLWGLASLIVGRLPDQVRIRNWDNVLSVSPGYPNYSKQETLDWLGYKIQEQKDILFDPTEVPERDFPKRVSTVEKVARLSSTLLPEDTLPVCALLDLGDGDVASVAGRLKEQLNVDFDDQLLTPELMPLAYAALEMGRIPNELSSALGISLSKAHVPGETNDTPSSAVALVAGLGVASTALVTSTS